jgi:hypothetical protein
VFWLNWHVKFMAAKQEQFGRYSGKSNENSVESDALHGNGNKKCLRYPHHHSNFLFYSL